ncbi:MAG: hypothetical protein AAF383_23265 [Cyanobacteria bacterium P01_A01_bin.83]
MIIRCQADADLNQNIITGVLRREPTINFQTATTAKLEGIKDMEVPGYGLCNRLL